MRTLNSQIPGGIWEPLIYTVEPANNGHQGTGQNGPHAQVTTIERKLIIWEVL